MYNFVRFSTILTPFSGWNLGNSLPRSMIINYRFRCKSFKVDYTPKGYVSGILWLSTCR
jgi:hypothetical protein